MARKSSPPKSKNFSPPPGVNPLKEDWIDVAGDLHTNLNAVLQRRDPFTLDKVKRLGFKAYHQIRYPLDALVSEKTRRAIAARRARLSLVKPEEKSVFKALKRVWKRNRARVKRVERPLRKSLPWKTSSESFKRLANELFQIEKTWDTEKYLKLKRLRICASRHLRRKVIMAGTNGKGLKVKNALWTSDSRIRC